MALLAYGDLHTDDTSSALDVTQKIQQAVEGNYLFIKADTGLLGDPVPNTQKRLKVEYTVNGAAGSKVVMEGGSLEVHPSAGEKLIVIKAVYGDLTGERKVDVTKVLANAVRGDKVTLDVNNEVVINSVLLCAGKL